MKTKAYLLTPNDETANIIRLIALCVPCFIDITPIPLEDSIVEYTIKARVEDWAWIERQLAPIV